MRGTAISLFIAQFLIGTTAIPCWSQSEEGEVLLIVYHPKKLTGYTKWVRACDEAAKTLLRSNPKGPAPHCKTVRFSWHGCLLKDQVHLHKPYFMWGPPGSSSEGNFSAYHGEPTPTAISEFVTSQRELLEASSSQKPLVQDEAFTDEQLGKLYRISQPSLFWREKHSNEDIETAKAVIDPLWTACNVSQYDTLQDYYVHSSLGNTEIVSRYSNQLDALIAEGKLCRLWRAFYYNFKSQRVV